MGFERFGDDGEMQRVSFLSSPSLITSTTAVLLFRTVEKCDFLLCLWDQAKVKGTLPFKNRCVRIMGVLP